MSITFQEPGGDATFNVANTANGGFWDQSGSFGSPVVATDFVHGTHQRSIKFLTNTANYVFTPGTVLTTAGSRFSIYLYINALPSSTASVFALALSGGGITIPIRLTSAGVLQIWNTTTAQIGSNGATLSTGQWYRISLAYTITSTSVNRFELFVNSVSSISITNATISFASARSMYIGNVNGDSTLDIRTSDHYTDDSSSLTDTGDIWVTAKRPVSNGTTNQFGTQIGSGGSGYGTGHSPQVNERPLSTTNGWAEQTGSGVVKTEQYNIEGKSVGDIDISAATIVGSVGWASISSSTAATGNINFNGTDTSMAWPTSATLKLSAYVTSSTYPSATGTDIGVKSAITVSASYNLFECGVIVAFIPGAGVSNKGFFF